MSHSSCTSILCKIWAYLPSNVMPTSPPNIHRARCYCYCSIHAYYIPSHPHSRWYIAPLHPTHYSQQRIYTPIYNKAAPQRELVAQPKTNRWGWNLSQSRQQWKKGFREKKSAAGGWTSECPKTTTRRDFSRTYYLTLLIVLKKKPKKLIDDDLISIIKISIQQNLDPVGSRRWIYILYYYY